MEGLYGLGLEFVYIIFIWILLFRKLFFDIFNFVGSYEKFSCVLGIRGIDW